MKKLFLTLALSVAALGAAAATPPSYNGGDAALVEYLIKNLRYPLAAAENGIEGRVIVQFTVLTDGTLSKPQILRPVDPDLEEEAIRLVKAMPEWLPAKDDADNPVEETVTLPINFKLS